MIAVEQDIQKQIASASSRLDLWSQFINLTQVKCVAEIGVYRGKFAAHLLQECASVEKYYMIDPWRHLDDWNKPLNKNNDVFEQILSEVEAKTNFAAEKRIILRGKTTEVIDKMPDDALDFCYIDGDHTLKGITIDLIRLYSKVRVGGWIGGDDFNYSIWGRHGASFEPTLVFPFAIYFAEAVGASIYALPYSQFLIEKKRINQFSFTDLTGVYKEVNLKNQVLPSQMLKLRMTKIYPSIPKFFTRKNNWISQ
ncbi:MAG: class I SAM-dependent methyltransferase [Microcoleaceae cyanobacterium]